MKNHIRKYIKQEKRIVKLLFRKDLIEDGEIVFPFLGWDSGYVGKNQSARNGIKMGCYPQVHHFTVDYWGEGDSHSIVDIFIEDLFWKTAKGTSENGFPFGGVTFSNRNQLIKYLSALPTKNNSSKVNQLLKWKE